MLFPTATFAIFFLIVLPLSWLLMPKVHRWRPFIIVASYVFYAWWDWRFILLLAVCTVWNQVLAVRIHRSHGRGAAQGVAVARARRRSRAARLLQVLRLLRQLERQPLLRRRAERSDRRPLDRAAGRDLLLHVHGDQLRGRHLSRRLRPDDVREVRRLPVLLPASRGRADRPARRADPAVRDAARSPRASIRAVPST